MVTNTDSSACAATTFELTASAPSALTAVVSPPSVSLLPGTTTQAVLTLASSSSALPASSGMAGTLAVTYVVEQWDIQPPTAPTGLTATVSQKQKRVVLVWKGSTDNDVAWTAGATYSYYVVAWDAAQNSSAPSSTAAVTLGGGGGSNGKNR